MKLEYYPKLPEAEQMLIDRAIMYNISKLIKAGEKKKQFAAHALTMDYINRQREQMADAPRDILYENFNKKLHEWSDKAQEYFSKLTPKAIESLGEFYHG